MEQDKRDAKVGDVVSLRTSPTVEMTVVATGGQEFCLDGKTLLAVWLGSAFVVWLDSQLELSHAMLPVAALELRKSVVPL